MTLAQMMEITGAELLVPGVPLDKEISAGYSCDLLSWVMGREQPGMAWITVQTHLNVIAVAELIEAACVILADCSQVDSAMLQRARDDGFALFASKHDAFTLGGMLYAAGLRTTERP
ncbi:MAG: hypothetical protein LBU67_01060 [Oscillospiraceae bacterium]|jgi:hypothetical protein|nr:hypothetical protein [Oscillospiraceae bacterium]